MTQSITIDARFVAEHETFLRRLARGLVGDGAEDAVQDAWLDALQAPPRREPRGYLATILRHGALRLRGRERQRAAVEAMGARDERLDDVVTRRLAVQEELARALRVLPDAQRTALYLRCHEDLTPTTLAARTGVPLETVKSRLTRGLVALRADLEARVDGDGRAWLAALVPLAMGSERRLVDVARWFPISGVATVGAAALAVLATELWTSRAPSSQHALPPEAHAVAAPDVASRESAPMTAPIGSVRGRAVHAIGVAPTAKQSAPVGALRLSTLTGGQLAPQPRTSEVPVELWEVPDDGPFVLEFDAPGWRAARRDDVARGEFARIDVEPRSGVRLFVADAGGVPVEFGVRVGRQRLIGVGKPGGPVTRVEPMLLHRAALVSGTFFPLPPGDERLSIGGP